MFKSIWNWLFKPKVKEPVTQLEKFEAALDRSFKSEENRNGENAQTLREINRAVSELDLSPVEPNQYMNTIKQLKMKAARLEGFIQRLEKECEDSVDLSSLNVVSLDSGVDVCDIGSWRSSDDNTLPGISRVIPLQNAQK